MNENSKTNIEGLGRNEGKKSHLSKKENYFGREQV